MELIERYLQAVKFWLPRNQKEDIVAELSEDIHAQVDEREASLGRQLSTAEVEALLKERGSPLLVANRFLPQRSLIGPVLYPIYIFVLKIALLCSLIPWLLAAIVFPLLSSTSAAGTSWVHAMGVYTGQFWSILFTSVGAITLVFAILERTKPRFLEEWNPRKLPPVRNPNAIPRSGSIFEIAVNLIFITWWAAYAHATEFWIGPSIHIWFNSVWLWFFWAYLALGIFNTGFAVTKLAQPWWTLQRASLRLVSNATGSAIFCGLLKVGLLAGIQGAGISAQDALRVPQAFDHWTAMLFPYCVLVALAVLVSDAVHIFRIRSRQQATGEGSL